LYAFEAPEDVPPRTHDSERQVLFVDFYVAGPPFLAWTSDD
jgi:hypothetical protein